MNVKKKIEARLEVAAVAVEKIKKVKSIARELERQIGPLGFVVTTEELDPTYEHEVGQYILSMDFTNTTSRAIPLQSIWSFDGPSEFQKAILKVFSKHGFDTKPKKSSKGDYVFFNKGSKYELTAGLRKNYLYIKAG